jgi:hypothetical protein
VYTGRSDAMHRHRIGLAAESDGAEKHVFVRRTQEALSVAQVREYGYVWKNGLQAMACGGGLRQPHMRHGQLCLQAVTDFP